jgi:hypothetical protein
MQYILDACTIINMLHIDEDEFLLKKISSLRFNICKSVFDETRRNACKKFQRQSPYPTEKRKSIEKKLNYFRERIYNDECYVELSESVAKNVNYSKQNGEFYSILLSFYLNTFEKAHIFFFTDDSPAKMHFAPHFNHSKIGYILDSVDLLILLYRHNDDFNSTDLKKFLSSLYAEYANEIAEIEKDLNAFTIPKNQIRNTNISIKLNHLRGAIRNLDLNSLSGMYKEICEVPHAYESLYRLLEKYSSFFEKELSNELLFKIQENSKFIDNKPFYKFIAN